MVRSGADASLPSFHSSQFTGRAQFTFCRRNPDPAPVLSHPPLTEWAFSDEVGAANMHASILAALYARERTGRGQAGPLWTRGQVVQYWNVRMVQQEVW